MRFKPKEALGEEKKERVSEGEREKREVWKRSVRGTGKIGQRDKHSPARYLG